MAPAAIAPTPVRMASSSCWLSTYLPLSRIGACVTEGQSAIDHSSCTRTLNLIQVKWFSGQVHFVPQVNVAPTPVLQFLDRAQETFCLPACWPKYAHSAETLSKTRGALLSTYRMLTAAPDRFFSCLAASLIAVASLASGSRRRASSYRTAPLPVYG